MLAVRIDDANKRRRHLKWFICATFFCSVANAETKFTLDESKDKLNDLVTRNLVVLSEDGKSSISLRHVDGSEKLMVFINPKNVIFPDLVEGDNMAVSVTLRSSVMKEPTTIRCSMNYLKYDFCYTDVSPKSARTFFGGEHVTIQLARTADRVTFPLGGEEFEDALKKVILPAEKAIDAKKEMDAANGEKREKEMEQVARQKEEQRRAQVAIVEAQKPLVEGRFAGLQLSIKLGAKTQELSKSGVMMRAKTALKKTKYEGKDAEMFTAGFIEGLGVGMK